jgi:lysophospholipase L1-like esterase
VIRTFAVAAGVALACVLAVPSPVAGAGSRAVLSLGDSLGVGTDRHLGRYLPGWSVRLDSAVSARAADVPAALRSFGDALPRVIVVSAGTNDDPGGVAGFARSVRETLALAGPSRCVVWATIVRPPYRGVSYAALNDALAALDRRYATLRVLDWAAMARAHPGWFGRDGVHPSSAGYRARASAVARLVERC